MQLRRRRDAPHQRQDPDRGVSLFFGPGGDQVGAALVSGFSLDGDAYDELVVGIPGKDSPSGAGAGTITGFKITSAGVVSSFDYSPGGARESFGASLDGADDYDGDGSVDVPVGAPNFLDGSAGEAGRVILIPDKSFIAQTLPYETRTLPLGFGANGFDFHFGAAVRASRDLNGDGVGETLVGAPDDFTFGGGFTLQNKGLVSVFSGATATRWNLIVGGVTDLIGDSLAGAVDDLDGDGFKEFVFAGSRSDVGGTDSGVLKCYRLFPAAPATYCTGKANSLGCTPSIAFSGTPTASDAQAFLITGSNSSIRRTDSCSTRAGRTRSRSKAGPCAW